MLAKYSESILAKNTGTAILFPGHTHHDNMNKEYRIRSVYFSTIHFVVFSFFALCEKNTKWIVEKYTDQNYISFAKICVSQKFPAICIYTVP